MNLVTERLDAVKKQIDLACSEADRDTADIQLIAVSKTKPAKDIEQVYLAGQRDFGENYLQEAVDKTRELSHLPEICWHFIGAIQSNKTRSIAEHFHWVQSVDRLKIARRLSEQRPKNLPALNICLQVNSCNEANKSGISLDQVEELAHAVAALPNLKLRGLMAIPLNTSDKAQQHLMFRQLKVCFDQLNQRGFELDTLSMGMSNDMEAAIAEGATMIRIGTAIFGERAPRNQ